MSGLMQTAGLRDLKSMREDGNYDLLKATINFSVHTKVCERNN